MSSTPSPQIEEATWKLATSPREWVFPRDFGAHPEYRIEWWYFTGNLTGPEGQRLGYQLTFFRAGVHFYPSSPRNPWSIRDMYLAHFTISDIERGRFLFEEKMSRSGPGLAGSSTDRMNVWLHSWAARMEGDQIFLEAQEGDMGIRLTLRPGKPLVFHGREGLSPKGEEAGQASFYTSFCDLATSGTIQVSKDRSFPVKGQSWFDHEFGSNMLSDKQSGWDWFSLHLTDGRELMIYMLRRQDGSFERVSGGTIVEPDGQSQILGMLQIDLNVLSEWKSPRSGGMYPGSWRISIPEAAIDVTLAPLIPDQELISSLLPGLMYWEGATGGGGLSRNERVECWGYTELTGYAGSFRNVFDSLELRLEAVSKQ
jgi:predicted secreted hydrolase